MNTSDRRSGAPTRWNSAPGDAGEGGSARYRLEAGNRPAGPGAAPGETEIVFRAWVDDRSPARAVVHFAGELDLAGKEEAREAIAAAQAAGAAEVVVDLRELTYMDSTGVALIVEAWNRARGEGRRFAVEHQGTGGVARVLAVFGLTGVLDGTEPAEGAPGR